MRTVDIIEEIDLREDDYSDLMTRNLMHLIWDQGPPWRTSLANSGHQALERADYDPIRSVWRVRQVWSVDQRTACWLWLKHPDMFLDEPHHRIYFQNEA